MSFFSYFKKFFLFFFLFFLAACAPGGSPDPGAIETIVAATVEALPSATDLPTVTPSLEPSPTVPSATPTSSPTTGPTNTPQPTATFENPPTRTPFPTSTRALGGGGIILPTWTPSNPDFLCVIVSQSVANYPTLKPREDVKVTWVIRNVGQSDWGEENIDIGYISGQKMAVGGTLFDLAATIGTGQSGEIQLIFEAPTEPGTYVTNWSLFRGKTPFCGFSFGLIVK
jgi:hypothetical protein